jgi:hypothetical protein
MMKTLFPSSLHHTQIPHRPQQSTLSQLQTEGDSAYRNQNRTQLSDKAVAQTRNLYTLCPRAQYLHLISDGHVKHSSGVGVPLRRVFRYPTECPHAQPPGSATSATLAGSSVSPSACSVSSVTSVSSESVPRSSETGSGQQHSPLRHGSSLRCRKNLSAKNSEDTHCTRQTTPYL